jgi:hypothetical protein
MLSVEESSMREKQNAVAGIKADERYDDTIWKEPIRIVKIGLNRPAGGAEDVGDYIFIQRFRCAKGCFYLTPLRVRLMYYCKGILEFLEAYVI